MLRHTSRVFLRRPSSFTSRSIFTTLRSICAASPKSGVPRAREKHFFAVDHDTVPLKYRWTVSPDIYDKLLARANKCWPPPPLVPPNWSSTWSDWRSLLSYYSFSPYYLMLPQVEMHINIQYGIRGETRPLLFSNKRDSFIFTIVHSNHYFLFDGWYSALYYIRDVCNDHQVVELVAQGDNALVARLQDVDESEEGLSALQRIMARDETVIPLLAEKFLNYTPVPTTPKMERNAQDSSPEKDAQFADFMSRWQCEDSKQVDDEKESDDKTLRELDDEIGSLRSTINKLLDENSSMERKALAEESEKAEVEVEEKAKEEEEEEEEAEEIDEEGIMLLREEVEKFAPVVEVSDVKDIPAEQLILVKEETKMLKARSDELIREMENFSVQPHQVEVFKDMIATAKSLRNQVDKLSVTDSHQLAIYLVRSIEMNFGIIKNDPTAIDYLGRDHNL